ncbi:MAG: bestrophin family ion channel [Crocinitomicaceae bacterium]
MIISFSQNPLKRTVGIVYFNLVELVFFALVASVAYVLCHEYGYHFLEIPPVPVSILGGALAIFLGFRNSSAYDRWWEARKIWGAVVNDSRSFAMELIALPTSDNPEEAKAIADWRRKAIYRHIGWLYALNGHLRKNPVDLSNYLDEAERDAIAEKSNKPAQIVALQAKEMQKAFKKGWTGEYRFNALVQTLTKFYDDQGKAERIKNTIFPYYYNYFTLFFLWLFTASLPFALAQIMDNVIMIPFSVLISFAFFILHKSGTMTENPFENVAADTPINTICRGIEIDLLQMIDEKDIPAPEPTQTTRFGVTHAK